jgi:hypothetical protein
MAPHFHFDSKEIMLRLSAVAKSTMNKARRAWIAGQNRLHENSLTEVFDFAPASMFLRGDFLRFGVKRAISSQVLGITALRRFLGGQRNILVIGAFALRRH